MVLVIQHWSKYGTVGAETSSQSNAWSFMRLHCIFPVIEAYTGACMLRLHCRYTGRTEPFPFSLATHNIVSLIDIILLYSVAAGTPALTLTIMPYPISTPMSDTALSQPTHKGKQWPAFPGIPIFLETHDERIPIKSYGTTPTTPTTPEILVQGQRLPPIEGNSNTQYASSIQHSPTTTIQTSSARSSVWPISASAPEVQQSQESARPTLRFFPTQRPRVQLGAIPTLQIPQMPHMNQVDEKTPINLYHPGLGIMNSGEKPPSFEITPPLDEKNEEDAPGLAERIEQRLFQYSISGNIVKRWLLELISWVFSAICMAAIIGVLVHLQDDKLSNWTLEKRTGLTLNAYISILSKMAGASLVLPVSEALGQLKWNWFLQNSKQMWDFEIFDNASRGPWGSFLLLVRTKGRALAALGAIITLCLMALDPFFQQVVDFPDRWARLDTPARVPRTVQYRPNFSQVYSESQPYSEVDEDIGLVANKFFYGNGTQPLPFGNGTRPDIPVVSTPPPSPKSTHHFKRMDISHRMS